MNIIFNEFTLPAFARINGEKRDKILKSAIDAFAREGFQGASINAIAATAGISIGSLYSYFRSKEDLFLYLATLGRSLIAEAAAEVTRADGSLELLLRKLYEVTITYSLRYPEMTKIYLNMSSLANREQIERLSKVLESHFIAFYKQLFEQAAARHELAPDVDPAFCAFCLDNSLIMLQYALCSEYYRERMESYLGHPWSEDHEKLSAELAQFMLRSFGARPKA